MFVLFVGCIFTKDAVVVLPHGEEILHGITPYQYVSNIMYDCPP
jgi:hypothetical protein